MEGKDLTQGNLLKNMIKFCIPLLITNLLNSMYNIVDGIWVGRLVGDEGMAAITNCWPITMIASSVLSAIAVTTSVMVAQRFSSTNKENIKKIITPIYIVSILLGIITSVILIITSDMWLKILNTPEEILFISKQYLIIYSIGYIFYFLADTIVEGIRATGDSKTPMILLTTINVINIILDPIFIWLGLGVVGAATASMTAMIIGLIINLIYINRKFIKLKKEFLKEVFKIGFPMLFAELSTIFTIMVEVYVSNSLGVVGSSSYGIVSKLQSFFYIIGTSIKSMITIVVAQFIGKMALESLRTVMRNGLKIILVPTILIALFLIIGSRWFCSIFTDSEEVINMAIDYLSIVGIAFVSIPLSQLMMGFVLGVGNTRFAFVTLAIASIAEIIILLGIEYYCNEPLLALGVSILAWYIADIVCCSGYYFSNKWKKKVIA